ncbi:hypothetical protein GZ77_24680 [Endozoicomonas montiporae]|uniref:CRISPR-associated protein Csh2 n=2 Tax=Endozoicomonas montiporae TaxID=1027273 RepID=A0A081MZT5_9GAMM|nr:CRISPR-associated protein [Endozoicomonas montiporae]AMO54600.1 CRISPR-associated Csh2 family protein [Endozoicomonas montiporae CL-33]KEQ11708.1 hypothetical protein GZ77_24680 [Endozoicomonas montiporae]
MLTNVLQHPRDIFFLFDIENGNPNGDPDQDGAVRYDDEVRKAEMTGICLKRKIRDRVSLMKDCVPPYDTYFSSSQTVLNDHHRWAMEQADIEVAGLESDRGKKQKKVSASDRRKVTSLLTERFYDLRAFGAPLKASEFPGEVVRGPCQVPMIQSLNTVMPVDVGITRGSVTNERDADKESTMGQFSKIRHAVFMGVCTVSAHLSESTGFSEQDFEIMVDAIDYMFEEDRAHNRIINLQGMVVMKHESRLRSGKLHALKKAVEVEQKRKYTETFDDYEITVNKKLLPKGVSIERNDFETQ